MQLLIFACAGFGLLCLVASCWIGGKTGDMLSYMAATAFLLGLVVAVAWAATLPCSVDVF